MPTDHDPSRMPTGSGDDPQAAFAAGSLVEAVRRLAGRLEAAARELHADDGLTVGERTLLLQLRQGGHQTIPSLAARRGATRQYVQQTLAPLAARGLVEWRENPRHRRSRLAALSPAGTELARRVLAREGALVRELARAADRPRLAAAVAVLAALDQELARALPGPAPAGRAAPAPRADQARA